ncbi:MAG: hypothetical protein M1838_000358 [Thelocarpon superellum]|nr:MAG: hypothetical protein M1838_000358 [Thelocarpon superellum]
MKEVLQDALWCLLVLTIPVQASMWQDYAKCRALKDQGRWLDSSLRQWQPPGCLLHKYQSRDIADCLGSKRLVFIGDSTTRQVFWAVVRKMDEKSLGRELRLANKHSDITFTHLETTVDFIWDPFLNSTALTKTLQLHRSGLPISPARDAPGPALILVGAGLWLARHDHHDPIGHFQKTMDRISHTIYGPTAEGLTVICNRPDWLYFAPVQVPWYDFLSPARAAVLTSATLDPMNDYLQHMSLNSSAQVLWSYHALTEKQRSAYGESGIHIIDEVAAAKADILLNLRCNHQMAGSYPHDRTCCSRYEEIVPVQIIIATISASLMVLEYIRSRHFFGSKRDSLSAVAILLAVLQVCWIADRTQIMDKRHKNYSAAQFGIFSGIILALGAVSISRSGPPDRRGRRDQPGRSMPDHPVLSRDQTDEWKGWMQFFILVYHYTDASKVLWIYQIIRLFVASYLFMTGFGHTVFFLRKGDYSLRRVASVLVRLNLLSCALPYVMKTTYLSYYFASLVTFWFFVVYAIMRVGGSNNDSILFLVSKISLSAGCVGMFNATPGTWEAVFELLRRTCGIKWDVTEWRFRVALDGYIVFVGMLAAVAFVKYSPEKPTQDIRTPSQRRRPRSRRFPAGAVVGAIGIIFLFFVAASGFTDKYAYNAWHPYISFLPILSFVTLRNAYPTLRNFHSRIYAWLGRCSLETFTLQFHLWLAGDTRGLLSLGWLDRDGSNPVGRWTEVALITLFFLAGSWMVSEKTAQVTAYIIDPSSGGKRASAPDTSPGDESLSTSEMDLLVLGGPGRPSPSRHPLHPPRQPRRWKKRVTTWSDRVGRSFRDSLVLRLALMLLVLWLLNMVHV